MRALLRISAAVAITLTGGSVLGQMPLFDSFGFESPAYDLGALAGQNGWRHYGNGAATVQNSVVESGDRALALSAHSIVGFGAYTSWGYIPDSAQIVRVTFGLRPGSPMASTNDFGFFFDASSTSSHAWIGGIGIVKSNDVLYGVASTGYGDRIGDYFVASGLSPNTWYDLQMDIKVTSQAFDFYINGTLVGGNLPFKNPSTNITSGLLSVQSVGSGFVNSDSPDFGLGYFDNYKVVAITVPEPGAISLAVLAGMALLFVARHSTIGNKQVRPIQE